MPDTPPKAEFYSYRYALQARIVPKDGKQEDEIDVSRFISELRFMKRFDTDVMPYYRLTVGLSADLMGRIHYVWRDATLVLTVDKVRAPVGPEQATGASSPVDTGESYLRSTEFRVMTFDGTAPPIPSEVGSEVAAHAPAMQCHLELVPSVALETGKVLLNGAWHDASVQSVVAAIAAQAVPPGKQYRFYMAPADSNRKLESVLLPPHNFPQAVRYLDEVHGLYAGRLQVFLDADAGYILSSAKTIAPPQGKPQRVVVELSTPASGSPDQASGSGYDPEALAHVLRSAVPPAIELAGPVQKELAGERVKLVGTSHRDRAGSDCRTLIADGLQSGERPKERVAWQGYDNPLAGAKVKTAARENYSPTTLQFDSPDLAAFTPLLPYTISAQDERYAQLVGEWRLSAMEAVFRRPVGSNDATASLAVASTLVPASSGADPVAGA